MPALTPIAQPPHAISQAEHDALTSSTPANFDDIPPVLRWEGDAEVSLAVPSWTAWTPAQETNGDAGEHEHDHAHHKVQGRLYVTEQTVAFIPPNKQGFALPFQALSLHALTPAGGWPAHIYCQLDEGDADDEEEYTPMSEMRIFVDPDQLTPLFDALSACSALHASLLPSGEPSSFFGFGDDDDEDDEWEDGTFDDAEDSAAGRDLAARLDVKTETDADEEQNDPISRFLAKVDWGAVRPDKWVGDGEEGGDGLGLVGEIKLGDVQHVEPGTWVDVEPAAK